MLPITGLDDWVRVRERLAALPAIRKIGLVALSLQEATIEIEYLGSVDQLKASLAQAKFDLVRGDPPFTPDQRISKLTLVRHCARQQGKCSWSLYSLRGGRCGLRGLLCKRSE